MNMIDDDRRRRLVMALLVALLATATATCGKKGDLVGPEDSKYPRQYPDPTYQ